MNYNNLKFSQNLKKIDALIFYINTVLANVKKSGIRGNTFHNKGYRNYCAVNSSLINLVIAEVFFKHSVRINR